MRGGLALPSPHVRAWYSYAFAAEVYSATALAIFLPIALERMARESGYLAPDLEIQCSDLPQDDIAGRVCKLWVLGVWVDSASFSMYVKSVAVVIQALCIVTIGPLADSAYWRKRILVTMAYIGATTSSLFFIFPSAPHAIIPFIAAILTIIGNASYATSIVCANAFLPDLAREEEEGTKANRDAQDDSTPENDGGVLGGYVRASLDEARRLLPESLVAEPVSIGDLSGEPRPAHSFSMTTSRISSIGVALGFFSGVSVLALLIIPITLMGGTTASMRLAVGVSACWWAVFTIPAWLGLPGSVGKGGDILQTGWIQRGWRKVGDMIKPSEIGALPNLFTFLFAWIFLSDGFHTVTYTAILYASSTLQMGPSKIILIGILVQLTAVISALLAPRLQARLGWSNLKYLTVTVLAGEILPLYTCVGLLLPFGGLRTEGEMYVAAAWFGLLYGPFNSYARAVYSELIPSGHESSFFSLFSLTDKSASFLGPAVVGLIADLTGNIRLGFIFLLIMLAVPIPILLRVEVRKGVEEAERYAESRLGDI